MSTSVTRVEDFRIRLSIPFPFPGPLEGPQATSGFT